MTPQFSVVVPVYNRDWELRRALNCLLAQTNQDFECLIVDDGSSNDISSIVAEYDGRFKYIGMPKNSGPSAARVEAFRAMKGDYLFFLDSDNEVFPWTLARASNLLDEHPSVNGVSGLYLFPDGLRVRVSGGISVLTPKEYAKGRTSRVDMVGAVRRPVVQEWAAKDPAYYSAEFHLWLTYHMNNSHLVVDEPWGRYNVSPGAQVTTTPDPRKHEDTRRFVSEHQPVFRNIPCTPLDEFLSSEWIRLARAKQDTTFLELWMRERRLSKTKAISCRIIEKLSKRTRSRWI